MKKKLLPALGAIVWFLLLSGIVPDGNLHQGFSLETAFLRTPCAYAEEYPYGGLPGGTYGEKQQVNTKAEAKKLLEEYFSKRNVTVGKIREKRYYFEADILDSRGKVVDKVIVDKRTGRIRSIY